MVRFRRNEWQVMIYRNGHIDIQRAKDIDDAARAIEMVGIMLKMDLPVRFTGTSFLTSLLLYYWFY